MSIQKRVWRLIKSAVAGVAVSALFGAIFFAQNSEATASEAGVESVAGLDLKPKLEALSRLHVYFGHQSVGANILDGLNKLATEQGVALSIKEVRQANEVLDAGVSHTFVAENGDPLRKLADFQKALSVPNKIDIAMIKFCYVDFSADTDTDALFQRYRETIDAVKQQNPRIRFVHITTPLTKIDSGWKTTVKGWLGKPPYGVEENRRRNEYNNLLRKYYSGRDVIFDLAKIESSAGDGTELTVDWKGGKIPYLNPLYTSDGGHLNTQARRLVAAQLVSTLINVGSK